MYISKYTMKQEVMLYMRERGVREEWNKRVWVERGGERGWGERE